MFYRVAVFVYHAALFRLVLLFYARYISMPAPVQLRHELNLQTVKWTTIELLCVKF